MMSRQEIQAEIERVPDERLDELYLVVKGFITPNGERPQKSIMEKLREIKIQGPPDFSTNIDLYLSGEKTID